MKKYNNGDFVGNFELINKVSKINWQVKCLCGHVYIGRLSALKNQNYCIKCKPNNIGTLHHSWKGHGEISHDLFTTYKHSANAKNLEFSVTIEYLWNLFLTQDRKCAFTNEILYFNKTYKTKTNKTASLDRINSDLGYIENNLQWVHKDVNKLKKNFKDSEFIEICIKIAKNYKNK